MAKTPLSAPVEKSVLNKEGFLTIRKKLSSDVQTVFTAHDTYIGVIGNEADLTVNGALAITKGATGVYTFPDGTCSIREGENTTVILNSDGSVTIDTVEGRDISELLAIANSVESRMDTIEAQFGTVQQGFDDCSATVNTVQSQFTSVVTSFNTLSASVSTYDSRLSTVESSVANVRSTENAQNTLLSNLQSNLSAETTARIAQGVNFLSDITRLEGKIAQEATSRNQLSSSMAQSINWVSSSLSTSISGISGSFSSRLSSLEFASSSFAASNLFLSQQILSESIARNQLGAELAASLLSFESLLSQEVLDRQAADMQSSSSFATSILALSSSVASDVTDIKNMLLGDVEIDFAAISTLSSSISLDINDLRSSRQDILSSISSLSTAIATLSLTGSASTTTTAGVFAFNEVPQGIVDGSNGQFTLANTPSPPSSLMLFFNGQLMTVGSDADYVINGNVITFVGKRAPQEDDLLLATYFYSTPTKSYKFNEAVVFTPQGSTRHAVLDFKPDPPNSLMLFLNGQLLRMGGDYELIDKNVMTDIPEDQDDVFLATYSHN